MKYIFLIVLSLLVISCAKKPEVQPTVIHTIEHSDFTSKMITKYSLSQKDLQNIQFYTSHDIVLHKQNRVDSVSISKGVLLLDKSSESDEIIIKAGTPCIFLKGDKKLITVSFDNDVVLTFVNPNIKCTEDSNYYLAADSWIDEIGTLRVKGEVYKALGVSGQSYLAIDKKSLENNTRDSIFLKGKKVI